MTARRLLCALGLAVVVAVALFYLWPSSSSVVIYYGMYAGEGEEEAQQRVFVDTFRDDGTFFGRSIYMNRTPEGDRQTANVVEKLIKNRSMSYTDRRRALRIVRELRGEAQ